MQELLLKLGIFYVKMPWPMLGLSLVSVTKDCNPLECLDFPQDIDDALCLLPTKYIHLDICIGNTECSL